MLATSTVTSTLSPDARHRGLRPAARGRRGGAGPHLGQHPRTGDAHNDRLRAATARASRPAWSPVGRAVPGSAGGDDRDRVRGQHGGQGGRPGRPDLRQRQVNWPATDDGGSVGPGHPAEPVQRDVLLGAQGRAARAPARRGGRPARGRRSRRTARRTGRRPPAARRRRRARAAGTTRPAPAPARRRRGRARCVSRPRRPACTEHRGEPLLVGEVDLGRATAEVVVHDVGPGGAGQLVAGVARAAAPRRPRRRSRPASAAGTSSMTPITPTTGVGQDRRRARLVVEADVATGHRRAEDLAAVHQPGDRPG